MTPILALFVALSLLVLVNNVACAYNAQHATDKLSPEPRKNRWLYRAYGAAAAVLLFACAYRYVWMQSGVIEWLVIAVVVMALVAAGNVWQAIRLRRKRLAFQRWFGRHDHPGSGLGRLAALALLVMLLAGCQYVAGTDGNANFTAIGVLTTPEVSKASVGGMKVEGYKRGIDAEAISQIIGAAVQAAVAGAGNK